MGGPLPADPPMTMMSRLAIRVLAAATPTAQQANRSSTFAAGALQIVAMRLHLAQRLLQRVQQLLGKISRLAGGDHAPDQLRLGGDARGPFRHVPAREQKIGV